MPDIILITLLSLGFGVFMPAYLLVHKFRVWVNQNMHPMIAGPYEGYKIHTVNPEVLITSSFCIAIGSFLMGLIAWGIVDSAFALITAACTLLFIVSAVGLIVNVTRRNRSIRASYEGVQTLGKTEI